MKTLLFITALFISSASHAGVTTEKFYTGNDLLAECEIKSKICHGYLSGIVDAHNLTITWFDISKHFCMPADTQVRQLRKIFTNKAAVNPETLHLSAASLTMNAFHHAYPCDG